MSQCARVLEVLADGQKHSIQEIHRRAGTMRLNSRVAELRKRGHEIVCTRADGTYAYQLLSLNEPEAVSLAGGTDPGSLSEGGAAASPRENGTLSDACHQGTDSANREPLSLDSPVQLVLEGVAA